MGTKIILSMLMLLVATIPAGATSPSEVGVKYDSERQSIHVSAHHPSENWGKHYLRRVVVYINDNEVNAINFHRQHLASGFEEDIPVEAKPGDKISINIYCSKGGSGKAEVTVPVPPPDEEKKEEKKDEKAAEKTGDIKVEENQK